MKNQRSISRYFSLLSALAFAGVGCTHISGFQSGAARHVRVIPSEATSRLETTPSTITLVRPASETWVSLIDALVLRADQRGKHYLANLQLRWTQVRGERPLLCTARLEPVQVSAAGRGATVSADRSTRARDQAARYPSAVMANRGYEPTGAPRGELRRNGVDRDVAQLADLSFVTDTVWDLELTEPSCTPTAAGASGPITLVASAY